MDLLNNPYYRLGVAVSEKMEGIASYKEIGDEIGVKRQNAHRICMIALGKVAAKFIEEGDE